MSSQPIITKSQTNDFYQIYFPKQNPVNKVFIQSLFYSNLLQPHNTTITDNYQTIFIKTKSILTLDEYIMSLYHNRCKSEIENKKYNIALQMIKDLLNQIQSLFYYKYTFFAFSIQNIYVLNNETFIHLNTEYLIPLSKNQITFKIPFQREKQGLFLSPEIIEINELPISLSYKCIYYSLSSLIIYFLFEKEIPFSIDKCKTNKDSIKEVLKPIKETKLYWFLLRIMNTNPSERWLHY